MKKLFIVYLLLITSLFAKIDIIVSIAPQKYFVEQIGKNLIDVKVMVQKGSSPHSYEPKASQMKSLSKAKLYFAIGVEFEKAWLDRFKNQNRNMKIIHTDNNIIKLSMKKKSHNHKIKKDPHIWLSVKLVKQQAKNILNGLISIDSKNSIIYKKNYDLFITELEKLDKDIKNILLNNDKNIFMVFHPSWGYFAKDYNLIQVAMEVEGKEIKAKQLKELIKQAKKDNIKTIFISPQFSQKTVNVLAKVLNANIVTINPLSANWKDNLIKVAKAIKN